MRRNILILLFVMLSIGIFSLFHVHEKKDEIRQLTIIREFPTEKEMNQFGFALAQGIKFTIFKNRLYFCSQFGNEIVVFNQDGDYLKSFGRKGQGPGDFFLPLKIFGCKNNLYVGDNFNARIQILTDEGKYKDQIKIIHTLSDFVIVKGKVFLFSPDKTIKIDPEKASLFKIFDLKGNLLKKFRANLSSKYNHYIYDYKVNLRRVGNQTHCLQRYGMSYLIYDENGKLLKRFELNRNPLNNKEYKKIKHINTFFTFCVDDHKIYTTYAGKGKIILDVFDMDGHYLYSYKNKMKSDEIFKISDMKIVNINSHKYIYLLLTMPDLLFIKAELGSN